MNVDYNSWCTSSKPRRGFTWGREYFYVASLYIVRFTSPKLRCRNLRPKVQSSHLPIFTGSYVLFSLAQGILGQWISEARCSCSGTTTEAVGEEHKLHVGQGKLLNSNMALIATEIQNPNQHNCRSLQEPKGGALKGKHVSKLGGITLLFFWGFSMLAIISEGLGIYPLSGTETENWS